MKCRWLLGSTVSAVLLGGCATPGGERSHPALADANAVPKVSVAGDRCLESFRFRSTMQGAYLRELIC